MADGKCVNTGKNILLDRGYNSSPTRTPVSVFKIGRGTTDPELTDTDLEYPVPISGTETVDDCDTADWTDSADCDSSLNTTTYKEGDASLNLTKAGTSDTECSVYKTTTSVNYTSKELSVWLYIKDSTALAKLGVATALIIRFGSDSSNYYEWTKSNADLTAGEWNLITGLTSSNADTTTGSPSLSACDYTYISLEASASGQTWSDGDFMIDDIKVISSDDYTKAFESGYPSFDYTNNEVTIRTRVSTTQGNNYLIGETGLFNTDGTPLMDSRDTITVISKTSSDEIIFVTKNRLE